MGDDVEVTCPCCGEPGLVAVETEEDGGEFVQDCAVCCRPWRVRVTLRRDGTAEVTVDAEGG